MSPPHAPPPPLREAATRSAGAGIDESQYTSRRRQVRVIRFRCTEGHVIEAGHLPTTCPAYVGGRPCDGELARW